MATYQALSHNCECGHYSPATIPLNGNEKIITQKITHSDNAGNRLTYQNPSVIFHKLSRP